MALSMLPTRPPCRASTAGPVPQACAMSSPVCGHHPQRASTSHIRRSTTSQQLETSVTQMMPLDLTATSPCFLTESGRPASGFGLGGNRNTKQPRGLATAAWEAGVNYFFSYSLNEHEIGDYMDGVRDVASSSGRPDMYLTAGTMNHSPEGVAAHVAKCLERFGTDYLDCFFLEYVCPGDEDSALEGMEELRKLQAAGLVRHAGCTTHSRQVGVELVESGQLDVLMARYNMAHVGAEEALFPAAQEQDVPVVAFTSTRWNSLQKGHPGWAPRDPPGVGDCASFALAHPAVQVVLHSARTEAELQELVGGARALTPELEQSWREYGAMVYDSGAAFESDAA